MRANFEEFCAAMRLCEYRIHIAKTANYVHLATRRREDGAWRQAREIAVTYGVPTDKIFPKRQPRKNDYGIGVYKDAFDYVPSQLKPPKPTKTAERLKRREEMFNLSR